MGGGENPEMLQKVPQKEISAEGVKKEGFHFDEKKEDMMSYYQRADTKERWKKHIEGDDYVPSPPSASSLNRSGFL